MFDAHSLRRRSRAYHPGIELRYGLQINDQIVGSEKVWGSCLPIRTPGISP